MARRQSRNAARSSWGFEIVAVLLAATAAWLAQGAPAAADTDGSFRVGLVSLENAAETETGAADVVGDGAAEGNADSGAACETEACDSEASGDEAGDGAACEAEACADAEACDASDADAAAAGADETPVAVPTHKQVRIISAHTSDLPNRSLRTMCLTADGRLLAACGDNGAGDVRIFDGGGEFLTSWELPFDPDAINLGSDGRVYTAGGGRLARFTLDGDPVNDGALPHADSLLKNKEAIREEVIASHRSQREWMTEYVEDLDGQIETLEARIAAERERAEAEKAAAAEAANGDAAEPDADDPAAIRQAAIDAIARLTRGLQPRGSQSEARLAMLQQQRDAYQQMIDRQGDQELTEEQIEQRVTAAIASKLKVSSISEADGEVFLATRAEKGYGFCVWRTNRKFDGGEKIVDRLSGCCGQMDVQACDGGIYVAENSRHSVRHFDRNGEQVNRWGSSAREGLAGFGSCCNPMNVAFGPGGTVYTAESGSGRIKRFSPEGELVELIGSVDLVPGCKKVSIAVGPDGDRVYMLDITRNHVVLMERITDDERVASTEPSAPAAGGSAVADVLKALVGAE